MSNKAAVKAELRDRLLAKRDFLSFCKYVDPKHPIEAKHIQYLGKKLEDVKKYIQSGGKEGVGRLMVFMPPRYWKSQTASRKFPAWILGDLPDLRIILTSYGADLATKHSKEVRDLIASDVYSNVFGVMSSTDEPIELDSESRSSAAWDIAGHNGGMIAAGVGGAITGFGANLFIVDDPFKSREDADSQTRRDGVWEWYRSVAYNRLDSVGSAVILIMTRWDQDDLAGKLLNAMVSDEDADQWDVVFMPAEALEDEQYPKTEQDFRENLLRGTFVPMAEDGDQLERAAGEALWPEKHGLDALRKVKANIGDYEYSSQYGQMPRLAVGEFLDDNDFGIIEKAPENLKWFRYVDLALGETKTSDFNSSIAVALDADGNLILRDRIKERALEKFLPICKAHILSEREQGVEWGFEDQAFQKLVFKQFIQDPELVGKKLRKEKPVGDKVERARPWQLRAKDQKVKLVRGPWNQSFIREATAFPKGRHDDDVDSVSGGVQMISKPKRNGDIR